MEVPIKILRDEIADLLIERSYNIDYNATELSLEDLKNSNVISEYSSEIGWTAAGTRALADDIRIGAISIEEGLRALTKVERQELITRIKAKLNNEPMKLK